jgi:hypothetical protein
MDNVFIGSQVEKLNGDVISGLERCLSATGEKYRPHDFTQMDVRENGAFHDKVH